MNLPDLTNKVGQEGCTINYDWPGYRYDESPHAGLRRGANSKPAGVGYLNAEGKRKPFRIQCVQYQDSLLTIHPDDLSWILPKVSQYMRVKPLYSVATRFLPLRIKKSTSRNVTTKRVHIPGWVSWINTVWNCTPCIPRKKDAYEWDYASCDSSCQPTFLPPKKPNQAMAPWSTKINSEQETLGPNNMSARVVCLPVLSPYYNGCRTPPVPLRRVAEYWREFWSDLGAAIQKWNKSHPLKEEREKPKPPPPPALAPPAAPSRSVIVQEKSSLLPLLLAIGATGAAAMLIYRSAR